MKLRQVKSEMPSRFIKRKIKTERSKTPPLRYSRRLRNLPPEHVEFYENVRNKLKRDKAEGKHVISKKSSVQFRHSHRGSGQRKLHYPQKAKNSKEIISIFSAPKMCKKMSYSCKKMMEIPTRVRGSSCRPKLMVKTQHGLRSHYTVSKIATNIKKEHPQGPGKMLEGRKKYVLEVLNKGDMRDIEKLPTVGTKTAERIILFRQLKGTISKISELAKMPRFPKRRFHNFVAQNFLYVE